MIGVSTLRLPPGNTPPVGRCRSLGVVYVVRLPAPDALVPHRRRSIHTEHFVRQGGHVVGDSHEVRKVEYEAQLAAIMAGEDLHSDTMITRIVDVRTEVDVPLRIDDTLVHRVNLLLDDNAVTMTEAGAASSGLGGGDA
ncbi:hypothetical protein [uncultured Novosphingobium sp.]|uniref:hypothetical protein n=1 Tax=uncultured Novosphingobium sp. TaxID=292277 RepID=UPI002587DB22|nr:hypothetical protein [uncultured Novosphingobium sp.]